MKPIIFLLMLTIVLFSSMVAQSDSTIFCDAGDPQYPLDPLARPAGLNLSVSTTHFVIHYTDTGANASTSAYASLVAAYAETSWTVEVNQLGFRAPANDGAAGGDGRYDIYLLYLGTAREGSSFPESPVGGYSKIGTNITHPHHLPLVVAHEFFHGCQYSYPRKTATWFMEATANWITQLVFPYTFDYYSGTFINASADGPISGTWNKITNPSSGAAYGQSLWCDFLIQWTRDSVVVKKVWDKRAATNTFDLLPDINTVLSSNYSLNIFDSFRQYAIWRNFVNARADTFHFKNAATAYGYPKVISYAAADYPVTFDTIQHKPSAPGGCRIYGFKPSGTSLTVTFDGQDGYNKWEAYMIGMKRPLASTVSKMTLNANARGDTTVYWANADSFAIVIVLPDTANADNLNFSLSATVGAPVTFSNRIQSTEAGGKLLLDNVDTVVSGRIRSLTQGSTHTIGTLSERFVADSTYKHHDWNRVASNFKLTASLFISQLQPIEQVANFNGLNPVTIRNTIIGADSVQGGTIQFKDPWYLNSSNVQPDSFIAFSSPLGPTGAYNQTIGGVFLNQGDTTNLQPPYYSVRAPLNQTIGNFQCTFSGWVVSGASLVQVGSNPAGFDQKAVVFRSGNASVQARYQATNASITGQLSSLWNLLSVPDFVSNFAKGALYPAANSPAFAFEGSYASKDNLANGIGYWVRFPSGQSISYSGAPLFVDTISTAANWNLIGSISTSLGIGQVQYLVNGVLTPSNKISNYFGYSSNGGYYVATTVVPGSGYWIKLAQAGQLILRASSSSSNPPAPPPVQPPPPPDAPSTPVWLSPANGSTGVSVSPTLSWDVSETATSYSLQVSTSSTFSSTVFDQSGIGSTSQQISGLSYSTMYYWHVSATNQFGTSNWSSAPHFTTQDPPPPPCDCCASSISSLDQFTISDATGGTQQLFAVNGDRTITLPFRDSEMPPITPKGVFDARFLSGKFLQRISKGSGLVSAPIKIKDALFPLKLSWDLKPENNVRYWLKMAGNNGKNIALSSKGTIVLGAVDNGSLSITVQANLPNPCDPYKTARTDVDEGMSIPNQYSLLQNYPNPFNPTTLVEYELPEGTQVILNVYDVLGQVVKTLVNEFQAAGYRSASFDASSLPSGVYFCRLQAGNFIEVKKMLLMR